MPITPSDEAETVTGAMPDANAGACVVEPWAAPTSGDAVPAEAACVAANDWAATGDFGNSSVTGVFIVAGCVVEGVHVHAVAGTVPRAIAAGGAAGSTVSGLAASCAALDAAGAAAANGPISALARGVVSAIGEAGRAANGGMFPAGFTSACASAMPCGTLADAVRSIAGAGCAVDLSSASNDAGGLLVARSWAASVLACAKAAWAGSDPVTFVDDSATGFHADASNAGTGGLARSSHGARSMGASNDGTGAIPDAGVAATSLACRVSSLA
ncbi:TPA: hypothetical protein ACU967_004015 [Burkholderia contaminans]|uniref:hypothetical protein n=1 Tax=Burkholderia TaxID=32008 RepID=UPI00148701F4|nr:hypothetical protein [Burkholderia sp. 4NA327B6]